MPRDYRLYLDDILQAIDRIMIYVQGLDLTGFNADTKTVDAVVRNKLKPLRTAAENIMRLIDR